MLYCIKKLDKLILFFLFRTYSHIHLDKILTVHTLLVPRNVHALYTHKFHLLHYKEVLDI